MQLRLFGNENNAFKQCLLSIFVTFPFVAWQGKNGTDGFDGELGVEGLAGDDGPPGEPGERGLSVSSHNLTHPKSAETKHHIEFQISVQFCNI